MINEATLRDLLYSFIVNYLQSKGIRSVVVPEFVVQGSLRADLAVYTCNGDNCYPFMVIETKLTSDEKIKKKKVIEQAQRYASILDPLYTVVAGFVRGRWRLIILQGQRKVLLDGRYNSQYNLLDEFTKFFKNNVTTVQTRFRAVNFDVLINEIQRPPTYENFLRAEFFRIINNMGPKGTNSNQYYPVSECTVMSAEKLGQTRADLVIFRDRATADCNYPLLVLEFQLLEFQSFPASTAISQGKQDADGRPLSLLPRAFLHLLSLRRSLQFSRMRAGINLGLQPFRLFPRFPHTIQNRIRECKAVC